MTRQISGLALTLLLLAAPAAADSLAESCEALGDPAVLPFQESMTPTSDDFDLAGCAADSSGFNDFVVCYTPENDCQLSLQVGYPAQGIEAGIGIAAIEGCEPEPQECQSQTGSGVVSGGLAVSAGVEICFVVEAQQAEEQVTLILDGDGCGDEDQEVPVELESFSVGR